MNCSNYVCELHNQSVLWCHFGMNITLFFPPWKFVLLFPQRLKACDVTRSFSSLVACAGETGVGLQRCFMQYSCGPASWLLASYDRSLHLLLTPAFFGQIIVRDVMHWLDLDCHQPHHNRKHNYSYRFLILYEFTLFNCFLIRKKLEDPPLSAPLFLLFLHFMQCVI